LDEASSREDGERGLRTLVGEFADQGYAAAAACLAVDLEALTVHLRYPLKQRRFWRSMKLTRLCGAEHRAGLWRVRDYAEPASRCSAKCSLAEALAG
jgi:hypothetical protein